MKRIKRFAALVICLLLSLSLFAQSRPENYIAPKEPDVVASLEKWRNYKFGIIVHLGLYSELGVVESWGLCPEDWVSRPGYDNYWKYCQDYRNTVSRFNPVDLDPLKWTSAFKNAGARYLIFTSKHHDGFCMYDSKYSGFKITSPESPYSKNRDPDILRKVLDAARTNGLATGVYFSKPDWNSEDFWWSYYPPKDRNPTYNITKHPERWKRFIDYTHNQINELVSDYGKIDILWLDGCWVCPISAINEHVKEFCTYPYDMDIGMKTIAENARKKQPGLLIVDRWVMGEYENYLTPEQKTPEKAVEVPWESCITMGNAWGWVKDDKLKSGRELVRLLVNIVAKGGNLLLGVGPNGKGEFEAGVYERLDYIGNWLKVNGEAIYDTRPVEPFSEGNIAYTSKGENTVYAIVMPSGNDSDFESEIFLRTGLKGSVKAKLLDTSEEIKSLMVPGGVKVTLPAKLKNRLSASDAFVIKLTSKK